MSEKQLATFLARYSREVTDVAVAARAKMQARLPRAFELVYDNYNALVIGYGTTERASDAIFSLALYPRYVTLFFLHGVKLKDPRKILKGSGKVVRHVRLASADDLDKAEIRELMDEALEGVEFPEQGTLIIKSISAKQRPRKSNPR